MSKKASLIQILVFLAFLGLFCVLHFALPDRSLSGRESLQTAPRFTFSALFSGRLSRQLEDYVSDQFPFRDRWVTLKAGAELASGREENNGIFLCENETLIEPFTAPEPGTLDRKLDALNALAEDVEVPVYFALIPGASELWGGLLPEGAPNAGQREIIDYCYDYADAGTVDMVSALAAHAGEPVYYRTDHHWTTLGAYYGYTALAEAMGFAPVPLSAYREQVVTEEFYGTAWSSSGFSWVAPDRISTYVEPGDAIVFTYPAGSPEPGIVYDEGWLSQTDKYSYFFGGNTPLLKIRTGNSGPKLLVLRDSYLDSLCPYLFPHFSEIAVLDLRYYKSSLKEFMNAEGFDEILVCYSVKNFVEDTNLFLLSR